MVTEEVVIEGLREVYDPELHYNIYDLGLVYDIAVKDESNVHILMTLTTPACPVGPMVTEQIQENIGIIPGVKDVDVEFTFDPAWSPDKMSDEAKADLGIGWREGWCQAVSVGASRTLRARGGEASPRNAPQAGVWGFPHPVLRG